MHEQYVGHKAIALASSFGAAAITLSDLELIFRTVGAGLGCIIAIATIADWIWKRWGNKPRGQ
jgi:hypothetical protein